MDAKVTHILLVDDDEEDYVIIRQLLARIEYESYQLEWVDSLEAATELLPQDRFDVYLIDYRLGPNSGLELLDKARAVDCNRPMIVLTHHDHRELDRTAIQMGAADYLPKRELTSTLLERTIRHAIERADLIQKLYFQATHDELTGLFNRKFVLDRLDGLVSGSARHGLPLSFCLCDVDYFKQVNDTYGHFTGDRVLMRFGEILRQNLRMEDTAGRYGGDEFCIIFPHISQHEARVCVERIRTALEEVEFKSDSGKAFQVTASFGISFLKQSMSNTKSLIDSADQALYEAKLRGRNQCAVQAPDTKPL